MRPRRSGGWIGAVIGLILLAALASQIEIRSREVERKFVGLDSEPLLAARRFLRRMGVDARTEYRGWRAWSPGDPGHTVIVAGVSASELGRLGAHFAHWVGRGGRLVIALRGVSRSVRQSPASTDDRPRGPHQAGEGQQAGDEADPTQGVVVLAGLAQGLALRPVTPGEEEIFVAGAIGDAPQGAPIRVIVRSGQRLAVQAEPGPEPGSELGSGSGWTIESGCIARRPQRAGEVIVLCDDSVLMNAWVGDADHALLLRSLVAGGHHGALIRGGRPPGLWALLWDRAAPAVVAVLVVLGLGLARSVPRFGPILERAAPARRSILEHIDAAGWFLWRQGATAALAAALQRDVERLAGRRIPHFALLAEPERARALQRLLGASGAHVAAALTETPGTEPGRFIETLRILQRARREL